MSNSCKRAFWSAVILSVFILFGLQGCGGKSDPSVPDYESLLDSGLFGFGNDRAVVWSTGIEDDEAIAASASAEKNADVSNVVWGHFMGSAAGTIKKIGTQYPVCGTVVTYVKPDEDDSDVYFKLCYRWYFNPTNYNDYLTEEYQVDWGNSAKNQYYPAVTAHLDSYGRTVVDVVYLVQEYFTPQGYQTPQAYHKVWHARYRETFATSRIFEPKGDPTDISFSDTPGVSFLYPDIVFDAGNISTVEGDFLHAVYTAHEWTTAEERDVYYTRGEEDQYGVITWGYDDDYISDLNFDDCCSRPRIDVGVDSYLDVSGYEFSHVENEVTTYIPYVGVVWERHVYSEQLEDWYTNVDFCRLSHNDGKTGFHAVDMIRDQGCQGGGFQTYHRHNVFPYIDIEPRENATIEENSAVTHICWTRATDEYSEVLEYYVTVEAKVMVTDTYLFDNYNAGDAPSCPRILIDDDNGPLEYNGLCTLAMKIDDESNTEEGYIAWLAAGDLSTYLPEVYAADIQWEDTVGQYFYGFAVSNMENISKGYSGLGIGNDFNFYPEIAIQDYIIGRTVWTERSTADLPDIYGDFSDWPDN